MDNPSIISHISLGTNDFARAVAFYDAVLQTIGAQRLVEHDEAIAYGKQYPEFWLSTPLDEAKATAGNGTHLAFFAADKSQVDAFHRVALEQGGLCDGKPGPRPEYGDPFYGCFVRDLDGHKIEATFWDTEMAGA